MRRARMNARWLWLLLPLVTASCDEEKPEPLVDSLSACLEQPTELQKPPSGQLPCELLPPGFSK